MARNQVVATLVLYKALEPTDRGFSRLLDHTLDFEPSHYWVEALGGGEGMLFGHCFTQFKPDFHHLVFTILL